MQLNKYILIKQICFLYSVSGLNILGFFDVPTRSLHILGCELFKGLASRGHNVTMISAFPEEKPLNNYTHIYIEGLVAVKEQKLGNMIQGKESMGEILSAINIQAEFMKLTLESQAMQDLLNSDSNFDIIIQTYAMNEAYLGIAHHFNARVIGFVPFSTMPHIVTLTGSSAPYSYVPVPILSVTADMNFSERLKNTIINVFVLAVHKFYLYPKQEEILKKYFPDAPDLQEIENERVDLIFSNAHFSNESPRPKTPNIVYIGGYHVQEPEPLSKKIKNILDSAKNGAVFLGFGTNVNLTKLPEDKINAFISKFTKVSYKVLIKYDGSLRNKPENVETVPWVPQRGVLAHPNTKIFVSHGGKGSSSESLYFGVPTLCVSFFGDQEKNCQDIVDYGYGVHLPYADVTEESFEEAFDELNDNPMYKKYAKYRSALFREQEMDPLSRANFWIQHIHKFKGAKHLRPKSATMPLYQYLLLDVWAFIFGSLFLLLLITYIVTKYLFKLIFSLSRLVRNKKKIKSN